MPSISQPFTITPIPRQSTPSPLLISTHSLTLNTNTLDIAISKYSISQYLVNPTPKLIHSTAIPSNQIITAFNNSVYGSSQSKHANFLHLNADTKIPVSCPVVNLLCTTDSKTNVNTTISILKDGTIQKYKDIVLQSTNTIPYNDIAQAEFIEDRYAMIITPSVITLYDLRNMTELRSKNSIDIKDCTLKLFQDKLYKYSNKERKFEIYEITTLNLIHSVVIPFIDVRAKSVTYAIVGGNRVILTIDNVAYLLDLFLGSVITSITFKHLKWFKVLVGVEGSFVLGISCTSNSGELKLEIVNLEMGSRTLKDSLGKSFKNFIPEFTNKKEHTPLVLKSLILDGNDKDNKKKEYEESFEYDAIFKKLEKSIKDVTKFDKIFFEQLRIKKDYYTEKDRFVINQEFLSNVIDLIINNFEFNDSLKYPKAIAFLLTHPLFPINKTKNLLSKFKDEPRLYKQTIVTCPNLPLNELLMELFTVKNNELSLDISLRILQDYTKDSIKDELKSLPKIDIENFIEFIIENDKDTETLQTDSNKVTPQLFQLFSLVIDSVGLFALEGKLLENLTDFINNKVKIAERNTALWYMLDYKTNASGNSHHGNSSKFTSGGLSKKKALPNYTVEYLDL